MWMGGYYPVGKDLAYYMNLDYKILVELIEDNGHHWGRIEELPNCIGDGKTVEELRKAIDVSKEIIFRNRLEEGDSIPEPGDMSLRDWVKTRATNRIRVQLMGEVKHKNGEDAD